MFKFAVVCALIAAAVAEPGVLFDSYSYPGAVVSSPEYYRSAYSNVLYNSPLVQPLTHLIKKRSASPIWPSTYSAISPLTTGYAAYSPLATSYAAIPYSSPLITTAHLIKKRSAVWPSVYSGISPLATSLYTPTIGAASYVSSPYYSSLPLAYSANLIKK